MSVVCPSLARLLLLLLVLCAPLAGAQAQQRFRLLWVPRGLPFTQLAATDDIEACFRRWEEASSSLGEVDRVEMWVDVPWQALTPYEVHVIGVMRRSVDAQMGLGSGVQHVARGRRLSLRFSSFAGGDGCPGDGLASLLAQHGPPWPTAKAGQSLWERIASLIGEYLLHDVTGEAWPMRSGAPDAIVGLGGRDVRLDPVAMARSGYQHALHRSIRLIMEGLQEARTLAAGHGIDPHRLHEAYGVANAEAAGGAARVRVYSGNAEFLAEMSRPEFDALGLRLAEPGHGPEGRKRKHD